MTENSYIEAFKAAVRELTTLMEERDRLDTQREEMDKRISTLRDGLLGLSTLAGVKNPQARFPDLFPDLIDPDLGITDAVRKVLANSGDYLSPVGVRDGLDEMGFDTKKYKNILASIHQILKRLAESNEVVPTTREGKTLYKWKPQPKRGTGGDPIPAGGVPTHYTSAGSAIAQAAIEAMKKMDKK